MGVFGSKLVSRVCGSKRTSEASSVLSPVRLALDASYGSSLHFTRELPTIEGGTDRLFYINNVSLKGFMDVLEVTGNGQNHGE